MALTVEDGTGVSDANGYIDVDFFKSYHDDRGRDYSSHADTAIEQAIVRATDYIEQRWADRFKGTRADPGEQPLSFPRDGLRDRDGAKVEGVPTKLKQATAEYAWRALENEDDLWPDPEVPNNGLPVAEESAKVGSLEERTRYVESTTPQILRAYPAADRLLREYIFPAGRVHRA